MTGTTRNIFLKFCLVCLQHLSTIRATTMKCRVNLQSDPISLTILAADGQEHQQLDAAGHDGQLDAFLPTGQATLLPIDIGKVAYDAYCAHRAWKSVRGEPLPQWDQADPDIKKGWTMAAQAA